MKIEIENNWWPLKWHQTTCYSHYNFFFGKKLFTCRIRNYSISLVINKSSEKKSNLLITVLTSLHLYYSSNKSRDNHRTEYSVQ